MHNFCIDFELVYYFVHVRPDGIHSNIDGSSKSPRDLEL